MSEEKNFNQTKTGGFLKPLKDYNKKYDSIFEPSKIDLLQGQLENLSKVLGTFTETLHALHQPEGKKKERRTRQLLGSKLLAGDADNDGIEDQFQEGEIRFKQMNFRIEELPSFKQLQSPKQAKQTKQARQARQAKQVKQAKQLKQERLKKMKRFVADMTRKIMSEGFKNFENGHLNEKKFRQFICNNVLSNIVRYASINKLSKQQLQKLDDHLKQKVLPFLKQRYPQNQSNDANRKFQSVITPVDNFDSNSNDLVFPSEVKFQLKKDQDYSSEIMRFINYLLKVTRQKKKGDENKANQNNKADNVLDKQQGKNIFQMFEKDMESIFTKVQDDIFMVHARTKEFEKYQPQAENSKKAQGNGYSSQKKTQNSKSVQDLKVQAEKQKYKQKVKSYTKYIIGKKIADSFEGFSQKEVSSSDLTVKDAGIMRILSKWCQQLEKCFEQVNINSKDERFRMDEGGERYIKKSERQELFIQIRTQYDERDNFLKNVQDNIYTNQQTLLKENRWINQYLDFCSEPQAAAGYFSTMSKKSYENYLVSYLNKLIHCILTAQEGLKSRHSKKEHYKMAVNLISFKIGDLLRCKCSSREDQIIAIYNYLVYLCKTKNEDYDMVRVKNRLEEGTRDILINLKYKKTLLVEMQLSINQETSNFIKCSDKANHFIYELERSTFGPISELCNVYSVVDPRAAFFSKTFQHMNQDNDKQKQKQKQNSKQSDHKCSDKIKNFTSLPVWCSLCKNFSSSLNIPTTHKKCQKCSLIICARCTSMQQSAHSTSQDFEKLAITGNKLKECVKKKIWVKQFNKKSLTSIIYLVYFNFKLMFFESAVKDDENKRKEGENKISFNLVGQAKKKKQFEEILSQWIILKTPNDSNNQIDQQQFKTIEHPLNNSLIKMMAKNVNKKLRKYFVFEEQNIDENILANEKMTTVQTLNMKNTDLKTLKILIDAFPNAKHALIHKNKLTSLEGIQKWRFLEQLNLEGNQLSSIPTKISQLQNLKFLLITNNLFDSFPKELYQLKCLQTLNFKQNKVNVIDKNIAKLSNLKVLRMYQNEITSIDPQIEKLEKLTEFDFGHNRLLKVPEGLEKLKRLEILNLSQNEITNINDNLFGQFANIKKVILSKNKLSKIPSSLKQKKLLKSIDFDDNQLDTVPSFIFELPKIQEILLGGNQLKQIVIDKDKIKDSKLKILSVYKNNLKSLPKQVYLFKNLQKLKLSHNKQFSQIPKEFTKFQKLKQLSISGIGFTKFPQVILEMKIVQAISFDENKVTELPSDLKNLKKTLRELYMSNNQLQSFPTALLQCQHLENLGLNNNKIKIVPDFSSLKNLQKIKLQGNNLQKFVEAKDDMNYLTFIYIDQEKKDLLTGEHLTKVDLSRRRKRFIGKEKPKKS